MPINLNVPPYYEDFDADKGFHQILFRPGYAVQARELTQLQSILRNQIAKFGSHIFKHGSVVIPGNTVVDLDVPYIYVSTTYNGHYVEENDFIGKKIRIVSNTNTTLYAQVRHVHKADNETIGLYLTYLSGGGESGENEFKIADIIDIVGVSGKDTIVTQAGHGSLVSINPGVFFINGDFVHVTAQTAVLSEFNTTPSARVTLKINEKIIDENDDYTLLDPAQGSYNYAAPGASRVKIQLDLTTIPIGELWQQNTAYAKNAYVYYDDRLYKTTAEISSSGNTAPTHADGTVVNSLMYISTVSLSEDYVELMRYNKGQLQVDKRFAQYSELEKTLARRTFDESGNYLVSGFDLKVREHKKVDYNDGLYPDGDADKFCVSITGGKSYINGYEVTSLDSILDVYKAKTTSHELSKNIQVEMTYGNYLLVSNLNKLPDITSNPVLDIYDRSGSSGGTKIGTVRVLGIDYLTGSDNTDDVYKLYYSDLKLNAGITFQKAGSLRSASFNADVTHLITTQSVTGEYSKGQTITDSLSRTAIVRNFRRFDGELYVLKNASSTDMPAAGSAISSATGQSVIRTIESTFSTKNSGSLVYQLPIGNVKTLTISQNKNLSFRSFKFLTAVVGSAGGLAYSNAVDAGEELQAPDNGNTVAFVNGSPISIANITLDGNRYAIAGAPANSTVYIITQVDKTEVEWKTKTKLDGTISAAASNKISLGKSDVYELSSVVLAAGGTIDGVVMTSATEITDEYVLDTGITDLYYGLSYAVPKRSTIIGTVSIGFKYYQHSATGSYFCVDSYPNKDEIPQYKSSSGTVYDLRNCIDFRPTMSSGGVFENTLGGSTSPFVIPSTFVKTGVTYYAPRFDNIIIEPSGEFKCITGTPGEMPKVPPTPNGSVSICYMFVPAYTNNIQDIVLNKSRNYRYTMSDIRKIEDRISTIEYYSTLNALENSLVAYDIEDSATGLNRYKTGYLVDNFDNPFSVCDHFNPFSRCSFDNNQLSAAIEAHQAGLNLANENTSSFAHNGDGVITLPYTEVALIDQPMSTRVVNLNPFLVYEWTGEMTVSPSVDNWVETEDLPTIYNTVTETIYTTREEIVYVNAPAPAPAAVPATFNSSVSTASTSTNWNSGPPVATQQGQEEMVSVQTWARDIGIGEFSSSNTEIVTFQVPKSTWDQNSAALGAWETSANLGAQWRTGDTVNGFWANAVTALNNMAEQAGVISNAQSSTARTLTTQIRP